MSAIPRRSPCSRGFTLIEMLMALLILTVGLLGLLQSVGVAYEHNVRTRLRDEAVAIAEEQLSEMRRDPTIDTFPAFSTAIRPISGASKAFRVSRAVEPIGESSRKLTVTVRWSFKNMTTSHEIYTIRKL